MPDSQGYIWRGEFGYDDPILACQLNTAKFQPGADARQCGMGVEGGNWTWQGLKGLPVPGGGWNWPTGLPPASGPGAANAGTSQQTGVGAQQANPLANPFETGANLSLPAGASGVCDLLPVGAARDACRATVGLFPTGTTSTSTSTTCPKGYHMANGKCVIDGLGSYLPGDVGKPDVAWTPVMGRFGQGASPVLVQRNQRVCPTGMVLGKDGVCYDHLARTHRAHNPGTKPLFTGGDVNAMRKVKGLQKKWQKMAPAFHKKVVSQGARLKKAPK